MSIAAVVVLLGAATFMQTGNPEFAATAGTYIAVASTSEGPRELTLTLREDATAELRTSPPGGPGEGEVETGMWLLDGPSVQIAFGSGAGVEATTGVTLERAAGALVAPSGDEGVSRFAGLTFQRLGAGVPATHSN
jgi:hypothetical protein